MTCPEHEQAAISVRKCADCEWAGADCASTQCAAIRYHHLLRAYPAVGSYPKHNPSSHFRQEMRGLRMGGGGLREHAVRSNPVSSFAAGISCHNGYILPWAATPNITPAAISARKCADCEWARADCASTQIRAEEVK